MDSIGSPRGASSDELDRNNDAVDASHDQPPKALPDDLPKSLDDRRSMPVIPQETEMYDAWQGALRRYPRCTVAQPADAILRQTC